MKKILSVLLTLMMLSSMFATFSVSNSAASIKYVGTLQLGAFSADVVAKTFARYDLTNYKLINTDLNTGVSDTSSYIYLAFQPTKDKSEAIRDIICLSGNEYENCTSWINESNGCTYYPVKGYDNFGLNEFVNEYHTINVNQDTEGEALYLFYTRDSNAGEPLTYLWTKVIAEGNPYDGKDAVKFVDGSNANLNEGTDGYYVYLLYQKSDLSTNGSLITDNTSWSYITAGGILIVSIITGLILTKKQKRKAAV